MKRKREKTLSALLKKVKKNRSNPISQHQRTKRWITKSKFTAGEGSKRRDSSGHSMVSPIFLEDCPGRMTSRSP